VRRFSIVGADALADATRFDGTGATTGDAVTGGSTRGASDGAGVETVNAATTVGGSTRGTGVEVVDAAALVGGVGRCCTEVEVAATNYPLASNSTRDGRRANRRVDVIVIKNAASRREPSTPKENDPVVVKRATHASEPGTP
jgi:hypothetical protein